MEGLSEGRYPSHTHMHTSEKKSLTVAWKEEESLEFNKRLDFLNGQNLYYIVNIKT